MSSLFSLADHRHVAGRVAVGQATFEEVRESQAMLLDEVIRLTGAIPVNTGNLVPADDFAGLIKVLTGAPRAAIVYAEADGTRELAGGIGSYRAFHDHLRVAVGSAAKPRTVADLLKRLRTIKRNGFGGDGGVHYNATDNTPVWIADVESASNWVLSGVRIEDNAVTIVGREAR